jgi:hypothetical protein
MKRAPWVSCPELGCHHAAGHREPHSWGPFMSQAAWLEARGASERERLKRQLQAAYITAAAAVVDAYIPEMCGDRVLGHAIECLASLDRKMRGT